MDYISLLSAEQRQTLCKIIGGNAFKALFNKYAKPFAKMKPGFRAKSLSYDAAVSLAINNLKEPFIFDFINTKTDIWMREIADNIEKLKQDGKEYEEALSETLVDSVFSNHPELYFIFAGQHVLEQFVQDISERISEIKHDREEGIIPQSQVEELQTEIVSLRTQITELNKSIELNKREHIRSIEGYEQRINELEEQAINTEEGLEEHSNNTNDTFNDTKEVALPKIGSDEIYSLCEVIHDYNNQIWLYRCADINTKGQYSIFQKNEDIDPYFSNRDKLYYKNGPWQMGSFGIWNWTASVNENDPSKDYISTEFNPDIMPIQVVTVSDCKSLKELVECLISGYSSKISTRKVMFAAYISKGKYIGILCDHNDYDIKNGMIMLSDNIISVPVYEFTSSDLMHLGNGRTFYKSIFAGEASRIYSVKSPQEAVKKIILDSISWTDYKNRGATRAEYKNLKKFIEDLSTEDTVDKICEACRCTRDIANQMATEFIEHAIDYIDEKNFDDEIIISAISSNKMLMDKAKRLILNDWETENETLIEQAKNKLESIDLEVNTKEKYLIDLNIEFQSIKSEKEDIEQYIADKNRFAEDVEAAVSQRIERAKKEAADFIAEMAFVGAKNISTAEDNVIKHNVSNVDYDISKYEIIEDIDNLSKLPKNNNWSEVVGAVECELEEAGVSKNHIQGLAAFLCAAYIAKQPLLIVGPNASEIVKAFGAAVSGKKRGVIYCEGEYNRETIKMIGGEGEKIVEIVNLISSNWTNRISEILEPKDIFFIATHPYAEDIQVEPKSLYEFMLPIFTEFFVDKKATGKYLGGHFSEEFEPYEFSDKMPKGPKLLAKVVEKPLIFNSIKQLLAIMHDIDAETTLDDDFLFAILPFAYANLEIEKMADLLADPQNDVILSKTLRRELRFILGDAK